MAADSVVTIKVEEEVAVGIYNVYGNILVRCGANFESEREFTKFVNESKKQIFFDGMRVDRDDLVEYLVKEQGFRLVKPIEYAIEGE